MNRISDQDDQQRGASVVIIWGRQYSHRAISSTATTFAGFMLTFVLFGAFVDSMINHQNRHQYRCSTKINEFTKQICSGPGHQNSCPSNQSCLIDPCGFKMAGGLDISVAGAKNGTANPINGETALMIFWSLVPYFLAVCLVAVGLLFWSDGAFSPLVLLILETVINEVVLKPIARMDRPQGSCLYGMSYGMPSGHACTSIGLLTYLLLEMHWDRPDLTPATKIAATTALVLFLAPVPYSRIHLQDHTPAQAAAGAVVGAAIAAGWFLLMLLWARPRLDRACAAGWGARLRIRHTYRGPWQSARDLFAPPPPASAPLLDSAV